MSMLIDAYRFGGGGGGSSFRDLVLSHSPAMYLRLGESSGTNADNETGGTDATYSGAYTLGNAALYVGGPTCYKVDNVTNTGRVSWPGSAIPSLTSMTLGVIVKEATASGTRLYLTRDNGSSGSRFFQYRISGSNFQFVKVVGAIQTAAQPHGITAGDTLFAVCTISSSGSVKHYKNGSQIGSAGSVSAADYGAAASGEDIVVGNYRAGIINGAATGNSFSEAFVIPSELSASQILELAEAAGFA